MPITIVASTQKNIARVSGVPGCVEDKSVKRSGRNAMRALLGYMACGCYAFVLAAPREGAATGIPAIVRTQATLYAIALIVSDPVLSNEQRALPAQKRALRQEIETMRKKVQHLYDAFKEEAEGRAGTRHLGYGPVSRQKEARYQECKSQFVALEKRISAQIAHLDRQLTLLRR